MKRPAPPFSAVAGAKVKENSRTNGLVTRPGPHRQISPYPDISPSWQHIGTVVDRLIARKSVEST